MSSRRQEKGQAEKPRQQEERDKDNSDSDYGNDDAEGDGWNDGGNWGDMNVCFSLVLTSNIPFL